MHICWRCGWMRATCRRTNRQVLLSNSASPFPNRVRTESTMGLSLLPLAPSFSCLSLSFPLSPCTRKARLPRRPAAILLVSSWHCQRAKHPVIRRWAAPAVSLSNSPAAAVSILGALQDRALAPLPPFSCSWLNAVDMLLPAFVKRVPKAAGSWIAGLHLPEAGCRHCQWQERPYGVQSKHLCPQKPGRFFLFFLPHFSQLAKRSLCALNDAVTTIRDCFFLSYPTPAPSYYGPFPQLSPLASGSSLPM